MDVLFLTLALLTTLYIVLGFVSCFVVFRKVPALKAERAERLRKNKSTYFLDTRTIDKNCEICFGAYADHENIIECTCGKTFHFDCVHLTAECPYCKQTISKMKKREVKKLICPICGEIIQDSVCKCGVVVPEKNGIFRCVCGQTLLSKNKTCDRCGAKFEFSYRERW